MNKIEIGKRHWHALGKELFDRTVKPFFHPSFVIFFIVAIIGAGALGIWIELYKYYMSDTSGVISTGMKPLRSSFASFIPAFVAATCMQLIWTESDKKALRAFAVLVLSICMLGSIFCGLSNLSDEKAIIIGLCTSVLALWTWWIANANQKEFLDKDDDFMNPVGGENLNVPLAGNLAGFQTD